RVVAEDHPQPFTVSKVHRSGPAELEAVEGPGVALHVAGQVQLDLALRPAWVDWTADSVQVRQREYASTVVAQANPRVVEIRARHVDAHIGARPVLRSCVPRHRARVAASHVV